LLQILPTGDRDRALIGNNRAFPRLQVRRLLKDEPFGITQNSYICAYWMMALKLFNEANARSQCQEAGSELMRETY